MATTKPRITITLTERQHTVLRSISESSGQSMSSLLVEFIDTAMPTLERMAATFQQLRNTRDLERARIVSALSDAQDALEPIALAAAGQFDLFLGRIEGAAVPHGSEATRATAAPPAPSTNRGATPVRQKALKGSAGKASGRVSSGRVSKKTAA